MQNLNMKKVFFTVLLAIATVGLANAQDQSTNCYVQWQKAFDVRGANKVNDGTYDDVILSVRSADGERADCYIAKVTVKDGAVRDIQIKFVNGKYEQFVTNYKYEDSKATITNGISKTLQTADNELVNVIFTNHLKPKKIEYQRAPLPNIDDL